MQVFFDMTTQKQRKLTARVLDLSIALEEKIGRIYAIFAKHYPENRIFWSRLKTEEEKHAVILEGLRPWLNMGADIKNLLLPDITELSNRNAALDAVLSSLEHERIDRDTAFNLAYRIELTASEIHFQNIMTENTSNPMLVAMQELCRAEKTTRKE